MDIVDLREYVISLPLVEECQPFGDGTVVYKIGGKMFLCCVLEYAERVAVKCNPDRAVVLRDNYPQQSRLHGTSTRGIGTTSTSSNFRARLSSARYATPT